MKRALRLLLVLVLLALLLLALLALAQWFVSGYSAAHAAELDHQFLPLVSEWWSPAPPNYCQPPNVWIPPGCLGPGPVPPG